MGPMMLQKINDQIRLSPAIYSQVPNKQAGCNCPTLRSLICTREGYAVSFLQI